MTSTDTEYAMHFILKASTLASATSWFLEPFFTMDHVTHLRNTFLHQTPTPLIGQLLRGTILIGPRRPGLLIKQVSA